MTLFVQACHDEEVNPAASLELSDFAQLRDSSMIVDSELIHYYIGRLRRADKDSLFADNYVRSLYTNSDDHPFYWINRSGLRQGADSLLSTLERVGEEGLSDDVFFLSQLREDVASVKSLDFDQPRQEASRVLARLEYTLTKAYLRYAAGQRFGFVNPRQVLNHFDVKDSDSVHVVYHRLYDIPLRHPDEAFLSSALRKIGRDSLSIFLHEIQPRNPLYAQLRKELNSDDNRHFDRKTILCNMERCRWQEKDVPYDHSKYVFVNIPAYKLYAVDGDSVLAMRVGCGTVKTKTPLLTSKIMRMDINPQWIIPRSIVEKDIVRHVGDSGYFARRRYFVRNRKSGQTIPIRRVSWSMLMNKNYLVIQEGGKGNSLGRIIFRFDNNFSVFLHDTSSPAFFSRDVRSVSHGCVRVQKPFELAEFLLKDKDERTLDRIRYSMTADIHRPSADETTDEMPLDTLDRDRLISSKDIEPEVPVFLSYFTIYPDKQGILRQYSDVYGYDEAILKRLKTFLQ
ncbi:MAG: L,D-transpeptidase family protein [Prevotella sp.]|nr:L,D-transpeptidase family protein [Prevotella sp.]